MVNQYQCRPITVWAVRWDGSNVDEVCDLLRDCTGVSVRVIGGLLLICTDDREWPVSDGYWVVRNMTMRSVESITDEEFRKSYVRLGEGGV